ncbi:MAG: ketoacyl-ACP synthase III [Rhodobacteraceae bacterium]|nr:ketoacyl-ACP synthase III [Paracoccaceae bacterium]
MTIRAVVQGVGHYLPPKIVANAAFEGTLDTTDEWIRSRTGIERRHFATDEETTSVLATHAARAALRHAGMGAQDIDAIVVATSTPDLTFPSVATMVQCALGMTRGFAFDIQAVCAGYIHALGVANAMIQSGQARSMLVIGAETFSRLMDWEDRKTCVLFGDGAGAAVLVAQNGAGGIADRGILSTNLNADGRYKNLLFVDGGVSSGRVGKLRMQGNALFRQAVDKLAQTAQAALADVGLDASQVDWVVPHQANLRIIRGTAKKMGIPLERFILTLPDHGNTSAASVPLALSVAVGEGKIKAGDVLLAEAIGGGLTWGAVVLRW